jgi:drug/metabolite transporter (DMT)-like permease
MPILFLLVFLGVVNEVLVRIIGESLGAFQLIFLQTLIAIIFVLLAYRPHASAGTFRASLKDYAVIFISALLTIAGGQTFWTLALLEGHLGTVSCIGCIPFEVLWGALLFKERVAKQMWKYWVLSLSGVVLLTAANTNMGLSSGRAELYAFIAGLLFTLGIALRRYINSRLEARRLVVTILLFQLPIGFLQSFYFGQLHSLPQNTSAYAALIGLGVLTIASTALMNFAVKSYSLALIGTVYLAKPGISFVSGALLFSEPISMSQVIGASMTVLGVLLALNQTATVSNNELNAAAVNT